jgi:hypothetical protein
MQRLFSMFPDAAPGIGLLLLRFSAATSLLLGGFSRGHGFPSWIQATAIVLSIALVAGYMTPIATTIGLLCDGLLWFRLGVNAQSAILIALDMTALALIGPGAFSADAFRYGRRILVPPPGRR